jgi:hypothetical protein
MPYTKVSTKGQAEGGHRRRQQLEARRRWAGAEVYEVLVRQLGVEPYASGRSSDDA